MVIISSLPSSHHRNTGIDQGSQRLSTTAEVEDLWTLVTNKLVPTPTRRSRPESLAAEEAIRRQFIPIPSNTKECEDLYTYDAILHWREHATELCSSSPASLPSPDLSSSNSSNPQFKLKSSMKCFRAEHMSPHNKFAPNTCLFTNLIKRVGFWTTTCAFDGSAVKNLGTRWYASGIGATVKKMNLRAESAHQRSAACVRVETRPTLMFTREQGTASNMFHELAQLLSLYITKHVHGIGDDAQDVLLLAFDRHHRNTRGRVDELLVAFSPSPVLYDEEVPSHTCFANAMLAFAGEETIAFWHKFVGIVACHHSPLLQSFQRFLLKGISIPAAEPVPGVKLCWILRGSYMRQLTGEQSFIEELRRSNPHITITVGEMGVGELQPLRQQILWAQRCNILGGAHGAGLTHSIWMPEESVVIEILPPNFGSYRTLVRSMGHQYMHVPAASPVSVDWATVKDLVDAAVHLVNNMHMNRGERGLEGA